MIHYDFKAEDVGVEVSGLGHVGRGKVGDDALDDHVRAAAGHSVSGGQNVRDSFTDSSDRRVALLRRGW